MTGTFGSAVKSGVLNGLSYGIELGIKAMFVAGAVGLAVWIVAFNLIAALRG